MPRCRSCKEELSAERLAAKPNATHCTKCLAAQGDVPRLKGFMTWEHKTAPTIVITEESLVEELQRLSRKGVHAQLPFSNKTSRSRVLGGEAKFSGAGRSTGHASNILNAHCHPDRPRATPDGKCVECALLWYERRKK